MTRVRWAPTRQRPHRPRPSPRRRERPRRGEPTTRSRSERPLPAARHSAAVPRPHPAGAPPADRPSRTRSNLRRRRRARPFGLGGRLLDVAHQRIAGRHAGWAGRFGRASERGTTGGSYWAAAAPGRLGRRPGSRSPPPPRARTASRSVGLGPGPSRSAPSRTASVPPGFCRPAISISDMWTGSSARRGPARPWPSAVLAIDHLHVLEQQEWRSPWISSVFSLSQPARPR